MPEPTPPYGQQPGPQPWEQPTPLYGTPSPPQPPYGPPPPLPYGATPQPPPWEPQPYPMAAPPRRSRRGLWIGLVAAGGILAMLFCAGFFQFYRTLGDDGPQSTPRLGASAEPSATVSQEVTVTLVAPNKLGGRPKITDEQHTRFTADTAAAMSKDSNVSSTIVAYYGTVDPKRDKVYLAGATTSVTLSRAAFDKTFAAMAKGAGLDEMSGVTDVEPGRLGGYARCGLLKIEQMPVAACAWADEASFVTVMWFNRQVSAEVKAELIQIRDQVETKA